MIDLTGRVFGRLTVIGQSGRDRHGNVLWKCKCSCGGEKSIRSYSLRRGDTTSCGCLVRLIGGLNHRTIYNTQEEAVWVHEYYSCKAAATFRHFDFCLTMDEYKDIRSKPCYYCGAEPEVRSRRYGKVKINASGIDRVDNNIGYVLSNVVPCCSWCNLAKRCCTSIDFVNHCTRVANHQNETILSKGFGSKTPEAML